MANQPYTKYKRRIVDGDATGFDTIDLRALLVMTNTTALSEIATATFIGDLTTLDEYDGSGYARVDLGNATIDEPSGAVRIDYLDFTFPSLGAGTRQAQALILYEEGASDAARRLIGYVDTGGFPFTGTGVDKDFQVSPDGLIRFP